jgi:DNA mismatch endonuclease (patch repair protein)
MRAVKSKNTKPEWIVRRLVHGMGYRYRLHQPTLPGKPDLVLRAHKKVILVHGCFWHSHQGCPRGGRPSSNTRFWNSKLRCNTERDATQLAKLQELGWNVFVVWECETRNTEELASRLRAFLAAASEPLSRLTTSAEASGYKVGVALRTKEF